ncbi:hypothetical protein [Gallaecimonas sp. GXIMD4217]|uniref:hypothetical protein n=1 Tax=Gallaecimonas sp. GXIMD4217 TaxID=3131927 RepID=UPI00311B1773
MYKRSRKYQGRGGTGGHDGSESGFLHNDELPELRRVLDVTDYDSGKAVTHRFELYRSNRIDCYDVYVDGRLWKKRIGWSRVLAGLRKAMPRCRAPD